MSNKQMEVMNNIESNHLKQNPFLVPPGYFESLPGLVASRIKPKAARSITATFRPWLALAASIIVLLGLGYGIFSLTAAKSVDVDPLALLSRFDHYVLLNSMDDFDEILDSEEIITFLTEHGVSYFSIAALD